jgi:hypothetical protein
MKTARAAYYPALVGLIALESLYKRHVSQEFSMRASLSPEPVTVFQHSNPDVAFDNSLPGYPPAQAIAIQARAIHLNDMVNNADAPTIAGSPFTKNLFIVYSFQRSHLPSNEVKDKIPKPNEAFPVWKEPFRTLSLEPEAIINTNIPDKGKFSSKFNSLADNIERLKKFGNMRLRDHHYLTDEFNGLAFIADKPLEVQEKNTEFMEFDTDDSHISYTSGIDPSLGFADDFKEYRAHFKDDQTLIPTERSYRVLKTHIDNLFEKVTGKVLRPQSPSAGNSRHPGRRSFDTAFGGGQENISPKRQNLR